MEYWLGAARAAIGYCSVFLIASIHSAIPSHIAAASVVLAGLLIALTVVDTHTGRLPNPLTLTLAGTGIAMAAVYDPNALLGHILAALIGFSVIASANLVYRQIRGHDGMGWGDAKLFAGSGAWVGMSGLLTVLLWACLTGLAYAALIHFKEGRLERTTSLPFGPHLAFGTWLVWLFGPLI